MPTHHLANATMDTPPKKIVAGPLSLFTSPGSSLPSKRSMTKLEQRAERPIIVLSDNSIDNGRSNFVVRRDRATNKLRATLHDPNIQNTYTLLKNGTPAKSSTQMRGIRQWDLGMPTDTDVKLSLLENDTIMRTYTI